VQIGNFWREMVFFIYKKNSNGEFKKNLKVFFGKLIKLSCRNTIEKYIKTLKIPQNTSKSPQNHPKTPQPPPKTP
jgi:hypothetical protein